MFKLYKLQNLHLSGYNPVNVGAHALDKDHSYGPAVRKHYLLHYVAEGSVTLQKGEKTLCAARGQCFIIRPDEIATYSAKAPWHYVWIGFTSSDVPALIREKDVIDAEYLEDVFLDVEANADKYDSDDCDDGRKEAYLASKISEILTMLEIRNDRQSASAAQAEFRTIKNYVDMRLASELKVADIAAKFNMSAAHLSRKFKKIAGTSPQNYIVSARLNEAAKLMREHGLSPTDAASAVGYPDIYLFSKMFKRRFGVSPREYKKISGKK